MSPSLRRRFIAMASSFILASACCLTFAAQSAHPASGFIPAGDGIELYYRVEGTGPEKVVLLHGGPGLSMAYLHANLTPLTKNRTIIFYDQRGGGRSTVTADPQLINLARHVEDVEAVRRFLGVERLTLAGHSWGAVLAVEYAQRFPDRVNRILLVNPMPPRRTPYIKQFADNLRAWMDETTRQEVARLAASRSNAGDAAAACRAYWAIFIRGYLAEPTRIPATLGDVCDAPPEALRNQSNVNALTLGPLGDWDWRAVLASVAAPTLIIHGDRDPIPLPSAMEWAGAMKNARLLVIANSGHFPFLEQPLKFFAAAELFLQGRWPDDAVGLKDSLTP